MPEQHNWNISNGDFSVPVFTKLAGLAPRVNENFSGPITDTQVFGFSLARARLEDFLMFATHTSGQVIIDVNTTTGTGGVFTLEVNTPVIWFKNGGVAATSFFTADWTTFFVSYSVAASFNLRIYSLEDPTP